MDDMLKVLVFGIAVILVIFGAVMLLRAPTFESECRAMRGTVITDSHGDVYCSRPAPFILRAK